MSGLLIPLLFGAGGLTISTTSPDALCPPLAETERAVQARLGSIELEGPWTARYAVVHRVDGDYVELELRDPAGQSRLMRAIPLRGESCATVAHVIALVIERFFERPAGATQEPAAREDSDAEQVPASASTGAIGAAPAAEAAVDETAPPAGAMTPPRIGAGRRLHAGLGPMLWTSSAWVAPGLHGGLRFEGRWLLMVAVGRDLRVEEDRVGRVTTRGWRTPASAFLGRELRLAPLGLALGPELITFHEYAKSDDSTAENNKGNRLVPGAGLRLEVAPLASGPVRPFVALSGHWIAGRFAPEFQIEGQNVREVLEPPRAEGGLVLGIGWWP